MSHFEFKTEIPQAEFDAFASSHALSNLLQSYNWSKIKSNWGSMHTGVYQDGRLVGTALVLIKQLPMGFSMFYIPRGPIMDYTNSELVKFYFNALKKEGRRQHALFIKMDPAIEIGKYPSSDQDRPRNGNENWFLPLKRPAPFTRDSFWIFLRPFRQDLPPSSINPKISCRPCQRRPAN